MTLIEPRGGLVFHPVVIPPGSPVLEVAGAIEHSAVDGPGNRYVLFLQGCNFDCIACHNPTTIGLCDACGACVEGCPHGALSFPSPGVVAYDAVPCDRCRKCVTLCPIDADPAIRVATVDAVVSDVRRVSAFLTGITVTGGEPTMQLDGLVDLFSAVKGEDELRHLTTLVDSNGTLSARGWKRLLPVMDGAMLDLKAGSAELHRELTGHGIEPVKESIEFLFGEGKLFELRLLVVEGVTDTDSELATWARFVVGVDRGINVKLMGFRHQGTRRQAREWPETTADALARVQGRLTELGLTNVVD